MSAAGILLIAAWLPGVGYTAGRLDQLDVATGAIGEGLANHLMALFWPVVAVCAVWRELRK